MRQVLGDGSPIGRTFQFESRPDDASAVVQIVGLVKDMKYNDLREDVPADRVRSGDRRATSRGRSRVRRAVAFAADQSDARRSSAPSPTSNSGIA